MPSGPRLRADLLEVGHQFGLGVDQEVGEVVGADHVHRRGGDRPDILLRAVQMLVAARLDQGGQVVGRGPSPGSPCPGPAPRLCGQAAQHPGGRQDGRAAEILAQRQWPPPVLLAEDLVHEPDLEIGGLDGPLVEQMPVGCLALEPALLVYFSGCSWLQ